MTIKIITITLVYLCICSGLSRQQQYDDQVSIEVVFSVGQIVSINIKNDVLPNYIKLVSNRFRLASKKATEILKDTKKNLLEELRTIFSNQYTLLFSINQHLVVFEAPNHFIFVKEAKDNFQIIKQYKFQQMLQKQSNIYAIQDYYALIFLQDSQIIIFNETFSQRQPNPFKTTQSIIIKQIFNGNNTCFIAFLNNIIYLFRIKNCILSIFKTYDLASVNIQIQVSAIERGQLSKNEQQIFLVDQNKGLFVMVISFSLQITTFPLLLQKQIGCFQLDTKKQYHSFTVLLTCRSNQKSNFIYLIYDNDNPAFPFLLERKDPYYQKCITNKYMLYHDYIFSQQSQSLDIFVPNRPKDGKLSYKKNWITLEGINNFLIKPTKNRDEILIYFIHKGMIQKKQLELQNYSLLINTPEPVAKTLIMTVQYFCGKQQRNTNQICKKDIYMNLNIHNEILSYVKYKSVSLALTLILATSLIALLLLCRAKYNSIYKRAHQDLRELTNPNKCPI